LDLSRLQQTVDVGVFRQQHDAECVPIQPGHRMKSGLLSGFSVMSHNQIGERAGIL
jgi:hypothetical protein